MKQTMPDAAFSTNLTYRVATDPTGQDNVAELDALGRYDSVLFLVEVKAGSLRQPARLGIRDPFENQLEDLIRDPHA
jgi:hypothetical protein